MFGSFAKKDWKESQTWLIDMWLEAGRGIALSEEEKAKFKLKFERENPQGFCFTIDVLYAFSRYCDAIKPGQSTQFMQRLWYLNSMLYSKEQRADLIEKMNAAKKKKIQEGANLKNNPEPLSSKLESPSVLNSKIINEFEEFFHVLDILQFDNDKDEWLDSLKLNYRDRFNKVMKLISPVLLDSSGGGQMDSVLSNVGKPGFWIQGLEILKKHLDEFPQIIFQMNFADDKHAIEVEYDATQKIWRVLDINTMPILETQNIHDVVEKLFVGFALGRVWDEQSNLVLSFDFLRLGNQAQLFQDLKQNLAKDEDWQDWRKVSAAKANIVDINKNTWLYQAVRVSDDEVLPKLVELGRHDHESSAGKPPDMAIGRNTPLFFKLAIPLVFYQNPPQGSLFKTTGDIEIFLQDNLKKILNGERSSAWMSVMDLPLEIIEQIPGWDKLWEKLFLQNLLPEQSSSSSSSSSSVKTKAEEEKEQTRKEECLLEMFKTLSTFQNGAFLWDSQYGLSGKLNSFSDFFQDSNRKSEFLKLIDEVNRAHEEVKWAHEKEKTSRMNIQSLLGVLGRYDYSNLQKRELLISWLSSKSLTSAEALRDSLSSSHPFFKFVQNWAYVELKIDENKNNSIKQEFFKGLKSQLQEKDPSSVIALIELYQPLDQSFIKLDQLIQSYKNQKGLSDLPLMPESVAKNNRKGLALELEELLNNFYSPLKAPINVNGFKSMIEGMAAFVLESANKANQLHQAGSFKLFFKIESESQFSKQLMEIHQVLVGQSSQDQHQHQSGLAKKPHV